MSTSIALKAGVSIADPNKKTQGDHISKYGVNTAFQIKMKGIQKQQEKAEENP